MDYLTALIAIGSISLNLVLLYALYHTRVAYDEASSERDKAHADGQVWKDRLFTLTRAMQRDDP